MTHPPQNSRHIPWSDIYEIDIRTPDKNAAHIKAALDKIEHTERGQKLFAQLKALQANIDQWPVAGIFDDGPMTMVNALDTVGWRKSSKLSILGVNNPARIKNDVRGFRPSLGNYENGIHGLTFVFPEVLNFNHYEIDKSTNALRAIPISFEQVIIHETRHAIDNLNTLVGDRARYTGNCMEERARMEEAGYILDQNPNADYRRKYADPESTLLRYLDKTSMKDALIFRVRRALGMEDIMLTNGVSLQKLVKDMGEAARLEAACEQTPENEQVIRRIRNVFHKHNIGNHDIDDATLLEWITPQTPSQIITRTNGLKN